jgi:hypothetical protein
MITIPLRICGDHWLNPDEVKQVLQHAPITEHLVFDVGSEGPSLESLGIVQTIQAHVDHSGRSSDTIHIKSWMNSHAHWPWHRQDPPPRFSHFFWLSNRYWLEAAPARSHERVFGFFVGRRTLPRMRMMWDLHRLIQEKCLFSLMQGSVKESAGGVKLDQETQWISDREQQAWQQWRIDCNIGHIDHNTVQNQYDGISNTNLDLLAQYHRFDIELVAESYTRGDTYFPTEKTIRPMVGQRPMLIYSSPNFLQRLRDQGFQTWHGIWDERYDQLEGPARWQAMLTVIRRIAQLDHDQRLCVLREADEICQHNHRHLKHVIGISAPHDHEDF